MFKKVFISILIVVFSVTFYVGYRIGFGAGEEYILKQEVDMGQDVINKNKGE